MMSDRKDGQNKSAPTFCAPSGLHGLQLFPFTADFSHARNTSMKNWSMAIGASLLLALPLSLYAADKPTLNLLAGDNLEAFQGPAAGWAFADSVQVDEKNPKKLMFVPGKGILINGEKGNAKDLLTKESFGDTELHLEFNIPKGSNSGVKFHAHYEIQICDSYGKKMVEGDDCGGIYPRAELNPEVPSHRQGDCPEGQRLQSSGRMASARRDLPCPALRPGRQENRQCEDRQGDAQRSNHPRKSGS
jgi:hypothetical protein